MRAAPGAPLGSTEPAPVVPRVVVIGGGHNGLICAAYLARGGAQVTVLERRDRLGGACVTEELWSGYRISRAAYVVSLLRPRIARELELERRGLRLLPRSPASFTPLADGRSLVLGSDMQQNIDEIGRFSRRDAERFPHYERFLEQVAASFEPLLDLPPPSWPPRRLRDLRCWGALLQSGFRLRNRLPQATRALLAPARELLCEWFESEPLRATLATDATIGAFAAPSTPGTGYVLFHHVMGSTGGARGVWAYVRGGMGALSEALADAAREAGAKLRTEADVAELELDGDQVRGVVLAGGERFPADAVVSCIDLARTRTLIRKPPVSAEFEDFDRAIAEINYKSPVVKINLALRGAPRFRVTDRDQVPLCGTIHIGSPDIEAIESAYRAAENGQVPERPIVELTIPSSLDPTLAPEGHLCASIFAQYAPSLPRNDPRWPEVRDTLRDRAIALIEEVAPGFTASIEHMEALAAPELEDVFGLTGGNIFQGAMNPDRLFFLRPVPGWSDYRTPLRGLYLGGAATHPGGGVMGACGRNAALEVLADTRS